MLSVGAFRGDLVDSQRCPHRRINPPFHRSVSALGWQPSRGFPDAYFQGRLTGGTGFPTSRLGERLGIAGPARVSVLTRSDCRSCGRGSHCRVRGLRTGPTSYESTTQHVRPPQLRCTHPENRLPKPDSPLCTRVADECCGGTRQIQLSRGVKLPKSLAHCGPLLAHLAVFGPFGRTQNQQLATSLVDSEGAFLL